MDAMWEGASCNPVSSAPIASARCATPFVACSNILISHQPEGDDQMATTMRPGTKTITMAPAPEESVPEPDGRKNQIVLVEVWHASLIAGGIRRVEGKFGQKSFAARVAGRDLRKLYEVALADGSILVDALEMWRVPAADKIEFGGPARRLPVHKLYGAHKGGPILRCGRRWCEFAQPVHWVALLAHSVEGACGSGGPGAGQKLDHAESRDAVARVFSPAQEREHVFDVRGLKKLQAAELHEWNVAPSQFHLERAAVVGGAEQN